ncbi:dihydrolipoyllysine-residue acetyltransferase component 1 of pyruvate dehydrogenase complex [Hibiscus syriacus]|uniref:Dihydrolipoyllysine-residue acetyltransferase component 1 of pyruvate dehydrogenase complex n=1 Tax=Hibiscus syriacus TaxID=106335 RepID=A0A6A2X9U8_HIBSY|nr:dihydrolipoyllysine-residue acetyltransferase component 1 of pyruvate dehydrogenase complex [Hibiscus syriacus]
MSGVQTARENETLVEAALRVLNTADPLEKARLGDSVANKWLQGTITQPYDPSLDLPVPNRPARLTNVKLVSPSLMPKLGKAGSLQSRQAIVHTLVHTESWAIDLSWVAQDEGRHFSLLAARLEELGSSYGMLPANDGLWDSSIATSKDLPERDFYAGIYLHELLPITNAHIEDCIMKIVQARGLDVLPTTISRFRNGGDNDTADLLERVVYPEEITHCAAGVKWFKYLCLRSQNPSLYQDGVASQESEAKGVVTPMEEVSEEVIQKFHEIVRTHFRGPLKPPFNEKAREAAGFGSQWYEPLAVKGSHNAN